eukprot:4446995-Ditylum_brightwellii.AAC.1
MAHIDVAFCNPPDPTPSLCPSIDRGHYPLWPVAPVHFDLIQPPPEPDPAAAACWLSAPPICPHKQY